METGSRVFVVAQLTVEGKEISQNLAYLAPTKEIHLKPAVLNVEAAGVGGRYTIRVSSPVLARSVYLAFGDLDVKLSDNYFNILPGETVEIAATTSASLDTLKSQMKVISLTDAFAPQPAATVASH